MQFTGLIYLLLIFEVIFIALMRIEDIMFSFSSASGLSNSNFLEEIGNQKKKQFSRR